MADFTMLYIGDFNLYMFLIVRWSTDGRCLP